MNNLSKNIFTLLSIGSNLGNRHENIEAAILLLKEASIIKSVVISSFYETEPLGFKQQPWFLNIAVSGYTELPLYSLIQSCKSIEYLLNRKHREKWHEREIDLDILLYGNLLLSEKKIIVPHPQMHLRRFVLVPAAEIAPLVKHPGFGLTIKQLLKQCPDTSNVKLTTN